MFWAQAVASFLVWIASGAYAAQRGHAIRVGVARRARLARVALAVNGLLAALGSLALTLGLVVHFHGVVPGAIVGWAWGLITAEGVLFVTLQAYAMAALASLAGEAAVTRRDSPTSTSQAPDRTP